MIVYKKHFNRTEFFEQRGATITEVILAVAIVVVVSPFLYRQIIEMTRDSADIAVANQIMDLRGDVINFLRINQPQWDDTVEIKSNAKEIFNSFKEE